MIWSSLRLVQLNLSSGNIFFFTWEDRRQAQNRSFNEKALSLCYISRQVMHCRFFVCFILMSWCIGLVSKRAAPCSACTVCSSLPLGWTGPGPVVWCRASSRRLCTGLYLFFKNRQHNVAYLAVWVAWTSCLVQMDGRVLFNKCKLQISVKPLSAQ